MTRTADRSGPAEGHCIDAAPEPSDGLASSAVIVGGGIGGLATAVGLHRAGWSVTVFERADALPTDGTGFGIWPEGLRALDALGIGARTRERGRPQANGTIRRPDGSPIATLDVDKLARRSGDPVYLLPRPALLGLLAEALPSGVVRFGRPVSGGEIAGLRADHDVVVGADGIRSGVRATVLGDRHALRYAGGLVWRGVVDMDLPAGGETWGKGAKFGCTPLEPGRTNFYAVRYGPANRPPADDLAELRALFGTWHDPIPAILDAIDMTDVLRHELNYLDPALPTYVDGNLALLGDAAHAMTPDLGQGACQALIDGVVLSRCLATAPDVATALAAYDRERRRPSQKLAAMSGRVNRLTQLRFTGVRDTVAKLALAFGPPS